MSKRAWTPPLWTRLFKTPYGWALRIRKNRWKWFTSRREALAFIKERGK